MWDKLISEKKIFNQPPSILLIHNCHIHDPHFHWLRKWIIGDSLIQLRGAASHENLHVFHTIIRFPVKLCLRNINTKHNESVE